MLCAYFSEIMIKEDYNIITFYWNSTNQKNQETE